MSDKPREWWIADIPSGKNISGNIDFFTAVKVRPDNPPWTHVIEYSAYEALQAKLRIATEALKDISIEVDQHITWSNGRGGGYHDEALEISLEKARLALKEIGE